MQMYEVKRAFTSTAKRKGGVVPSEWILQPCPLVPKFPKDISTLDFDEHTCLEKHDTFFVNSFHDQATYQTIF